MPKLTRPALLELAEMAGRLERLLNERNMTDSIDLVDEVVSRTRKLGVRSGFIEFLVAIHYDLSGDPLTAYAHIKEAIAMDPAAAPCRHSEAVIIRRLRESLRAPGRADDDAKTLRTWRLLVDLGEADDSSHLALARYYVARDNALEALRVLEALTTLAPSNREAWLLKASVATKMGDAKLAARATAEAAALEGEPVPFAIVAEAQG